MKKLIFPTILAALFLGIFLLSACGRSSGNTDTDKESTGSDDLTIVTEDATDPGETGDTAAEGEDTTTGNINSAVTAPPRYDYFEAEVIKDVVMDPDIYKDMQLTLPSTLLITDEDVQAWITSKLFQYRTADNGTTQVTDQPLRNGDSAFIYYKGTIDGEVFQGGSNMDDEEPYELALGSGTFIPGFEEGLIGLIPNQTSKEEPYALHVTFPDTYGNKELKGKEAIFYVVIEYAVQYSVPEYNKAFVVDTLTYKPQETIYASDEALLKEFEDSIRAQLEENNASNIEYAKIDALWTFLTDNITCNNKSEEEMTFYYDSYVSEIEYYYNMYLSYYGDVFEQDFPTIAPFAVWYMGMDDDADWEAELRRLSDLMVQKDMITHAIGELEGIESVTDEEYQEEVNYWVSQYSGYMTADEIVQSMGELYLRESAYAEKMSTWLLEHATFTFADTAE